MKNYLKQHIESGVYENPPVAGAHSYNNIKGWTDHFLHDDLVLSHRTNAYTDENFEEGLRRHEYYEVIVYIAGDVEYVRENDVITPKPGMIISSTPGEMHTARLLANGIYERYVLYFNREFFSYRGTAYPMPSFIDQKNSQGALLPDEATFERLGELLATAEEAASKDTVAKRALAHSCIVQFFALLGESSDNGRSSATLPENVARIKKYIDTYYGSIEGVSEIASYFFYSREHASRLFRQYFNITLSDYLMQRRIAESTKLLLDGSSVADACYTVGFRSISSFINAFRRVTGCLPSEYKKKK